MRTILQDVSMLTCSFQTTIPESIREALHLEESDIIQYSVLASGDVMIQGVPAPDTLESDHSGSAYPSFDSLRTKMNNEIQGFSVTEMMALLAEIELIKQRDH